MQNIDFYHNTLDAYFSYALENYITQIQQSGKSKIPLASDTLKTTRFCCYLFIHESF